MDEIRESCEVHRPPVVAVDSTMHHFPTGTVPLDVSVLEANPGRLSPSTANRTSTSLAYSCGCARQSGPMSQAKRSACGTSTARTTPQVHSVPSVPRSKIRPPTLASKTVSAIGTARRLCSRGLIESNASVKTQNASLSPKGTTTLRWTTGELSITAPPLWNRPERRRTH